MGWEIRCACLVTFISPSRSAAIATHGAVAVFSAGRRGVVVSSIRFRCLCMIQSLDLNFAQEEGMIALC